jgi:hypothetical protein
VLKERYKYVIYVYVYTNIEKANSRILLNRTGPVLKSKLVFVEIKYVLRTISKLETMMFIEERNHLIHNQ